MLKKTTAKLSLNLFIDNLLCWVLGSFLYLTAAAIANWVSIILTCIVVLILWAILHGSCWHEAQRDRNRVKYGHMQKFMQKGVVAGLFATIPFLIIYILYAVNISNSQNFVYYILYIIFNLPYLTFAVAFRANALVLALLLLPMPIVSCLGYFAGYNNITFMDKLIYKNKKKQPSKSPTVQ